MTVNIQLYNATYSQLPEIKLPIFIGISVGIKPMSIDIATSYLKWAEKYSTDTVQILVADEIAKFNYLACSHSTIPGALNRAIRDGDKYCMFFETVINSFSENKRSRFNVIRWRDIKTERFYTVLKELTLLFEADEVFKSIVLSFASKYLDRRGKKISYQKKMFLCRYILHELSVLLDGIYINKQHYHFILYPTYRLSGMSGLVEDIQMGQKFTSLKHTLNLNKTIMAEWIIESKDTGNYSLDRIFM